MFSVEQEYMSEDMLELAEYGSASASGFVPFNNTEPQENVSHLSCAARNIQGSVVLPYSETEVIVARVVHAIYTALLMLVGGFLNLLMIVLVAKYKKLHTVTFGIALQIVAIDISVCILIHPLSLITVIANRWVFTEYICSLVGIALSTEFSAKLLVMLIFVIDRFLSVFCPYSYPRHQTKTVVIFSVIAFILSVLSSGIGYILDCYGFYPNTWQCALTFDCSKNCSTYFGLLGVFLVLVRITSFFLFGLLFVKAWKTKKAMAEATETVSTQQAKYNWKATITFFVLFVSLFVLYIPSIAIIALTDILYGEENKLSPIANVLQTVAIYISLFLTIIDPIIFMRNGDVREVLQEIKAELTLKKQI